MIFSFLQNGHRRSPGLMLPSLQQQHQQQQQQQQQQQHQLPNVSITPTPPISTFITKSPPKKRKPICKQVEI